jgi:hypothetical protein
MRRSFLVGLVPCLAFAAVVASTKEAAAGPYLGLDLDFGTAFATRANATAVDFSAGGGARLGYRYNLPGTYLWLQPEVGGHYMRFGFNSAYTGGNDYAGTLNGGLRAGLQGLVQPNAFAHLGLGFLGTQISSTEDRLFFGPNFDIGAGLDFRVARGFTLGLQVAYNMAAVPSSAFNGEAAKWVNFGVNAGFHFGEPPPRRVYYR